MFRLCVFLPRSQNLELALNRKESEIGVTLLTGLDLEWQASYAMHGFVNGCIESTSLTVYFPDTRYKSSGFVESTRLFSYE